MVDKELKDIIVRIGIVSIFFYFLFPIIDIILTSIVFTYIIYPFKKKINFFLKNDALSSILTLLFWFVIFGYLIFTFFLDILHIFVVQLGSFLETPVFKEFINTGTSFFQNPIVKNVFGETGYSSILNFLTSLTTNFIQSTPTILINISLLIFFSYYFLKDKDYFLKITSNFFGNKYKQEASDSIKLVDKVFKAVVYGYLVNALIIGTIVGGVLFLLKTPQALLLGFLSVLFSIIPALGPTLPLAIGIIYFITKGAYFEVVILGILVIFLNFLDNIIRALFSNWINKDVKIHPAVFIAGLIVGPVFFGFIGLLIGPVIFGFLSNIEKVLTH